MTRRNTMGDLKAGLPRCGPAIAAGLLAAADLSWLAIDTMEGPPAAPVIRKTPARTATPSPSAHPAIDRILRETDDIIREERITLLTKDPDETSIASELDHLTAHHHGAVAAELSIRLYRGWVDRNPAAATAWAAQLAPGGFRNEVVLQTAISLAGSDLIDAAAWARALPADAERHAALLAVAHEAVRTAPMTALEIASELPPDAATRELVRRAAMEWAATDPRGAVAWADEIGEPSFREAILSGAILAWAEADPEAAATAAANDLDPGRPQCDLVVGIVQRWAQQDAAPAAAWVESLPRGTLRADATANLLQQWSKREPAAAAGWAARQAPR